MRSTWTGRRLSLLSILELLRKGCSTGAEGHLTGVEFSHPDLSKDACKLYKMSRNTNRHSLNHLGGVTNKKWKAEWKENFISNPPCGTWLFSTYVLLSLLMSGGYQGNRSWLKIFQLYLHFPDSVDTHLITEKKQPSLSFVAGSRRTNSEKGTGSHLTSFIAGLCYYQLCHLGKFLYLSCLSFLIQNWKNNNNASLLGHSLGLNKIIKWVN